MYNNTIWHRPGAGVAKHAFAGIHITFFNEGGGNHGGSNFWGNTIESNIDKLAFGIIVGPHPWDSGQWVSNSGTVSDHATLTGAVVNLAIDGITNGVVTGNNPSGAQGTQGYNCSLAMDYTAADYGSASLQQNPSPFCVVYHGTCSFVSCQP